MEPSVLGINFAAGSAYLGVVRRPRVVVIDSTAKLTPAKNLGEWTRLRQFGERVVAEARAFGATRVMFAQPRRFNLWSWSDAYDRASLQVSAGLALDAAGIETATIAQKSAAATLKMSDGSLDSGLAARLGVQELPVHWTKRVPAFAVAWHGAAELWP